MRAWLKVLIVLFVALFVASGCAADPRRGVDVSAPPVPVTYITTGNSHFVTIFVAHRSSSQLFPVSVPRLLEAPTPLEHAVALLNGDFNNPDFRLHGGPDTRIVGFTMNSGTLELDMSPAFQTWGSRNPAEARAFLGATVLTLTSFADVQAVRFVSAGRPIQGMVGGFNLGALVSRPTLVNASSVREPHATIYALAEASQLLVPLTVTLTRREPQAALQALLNFAPQGGLISPLPRGVQVKGLSIDNGIAVVNLDRSVVNLFLRGAFHERLVVDAIVQTLLEFAGVRQVQFLVDGRVLGPLSDSIDLSVPIGRTPVNLIKRAE